MTANLKVKNKLTIGLKVADGKLGLLSDWPNGLNACTNLRAIGFIRINKDIRRVFELRTLRSTLRRSST